MNVCCPVVDCCCCWLIGSICPGGSGPYWPAEGAEVPEEAWYWGSAAIGQTRKRAHRHKSCASNHKSFAFNTYHLKIGSTRLARRSRPAAAAVEAMIVPAKEGKL